MIYHFLFPFGQIPRGSTIVLYGAGCVGQEYYSQVKQTEYCFIIKWVDQKFNHAAADSFCSGANGILSVDFDYVVIALESGEAFDCVANMLQNTFHVDKTKIVPCRPKGAVCIRLPEITEIFVQKSEEYLSILEEFYFKPQQFGEGNFYQSFEEIGLTGQRLTRERMEKYKLSLWVRSDFDVLDIGCNCGFLDLQIAPDVRSITGVDCNESLVQIAKKMGQMLNIDNCSFVCADFKNLRDIGRYDMIFAFSVMCWLDISISDFADKINALLKRNGFLFLESHNVESTERFEVYKQSLEAFVKLGYHIVHQGSLCDDGKITREFCVLQREGMK